MIIACIHILPLVPEFLGPISTPRASPGVGPSLSPRHGVENLALLELLPLLGGIQILLHDGRDA